MEDESSDDDENEETCEMSDAEYSDQMSLKQAMQVLESAGVECVWANTEMTDLYSVDLKGQTINEAA